MERRCEWRGDVSGEGTGFWMCAVDCCAFM